MQQIVNFIIRNKTFLLFLFLLFISISLTVQTHSYHRSRFINSANFLSGGVFNLSNGVSNYFNLNEQNRILQEENKQLKALLYNANTILDSTFIDSTSFDNKYKFTAAQVYRNSYASSNNILLINKGKKDIIKEDFGVVTSKGILGIVEKTSGNYATVISILNTTSSISAKLKKTNHFGSLKWNTESPKIIQLSEIPKIAPVLKGDTIVTSGRSSIFPKGIPIGVISKFELDTAENYYKIDVELFNDMTNIEHVYVIENKDANAINNILENND